MSLPETDTDLQEAARYGSGVPDRLKLQDLSYIEMTGVPRRVAGIKGAERPETTFLPTVAPPLPTPMHADALFQALIDELEGDTTSTVTRPRPAGATQALAEAESLLQALDRMPPRTGALSCE